MPVQAQGGSRHAPVGMGECKLILLFLKSSCEIVHTKKTKRKREVLKHCGSEGWSRVTMGLRTRTHYLEGCAGETWKSNGVEGDEGVLWRRTPSITCGLWEVICWPWSWVGRRGRFGSVCKKVHHKSKLLLLFIWNWGEAFIIKNIYAQKCMKNMHAVVITLKCVSLLLF